MPFLTPGNYEISVTAPGFPKTVVDNVVVSVGSRAGVDLALKTGAITETVTVEDTAPLVQTEKRQHRSGYYQPAID